MIFLLVLALACQLGTSLGAAVHNTNCDIRRFTKCTEALAEKMGMSELPSSVGPAVLDIKNLLNKLGLQGQKQICQVQADFKSCLGDQYNSCVSIDFLQYVGETASDAAGYFTLATEEDYFCTTAWDVVSKNWDCGYNTYKSNLTYFDKCSADYDAKVKKDPANICKYNQQLSDCLASPYNKACSSEVANVMCTGLKLAYAGIYPQCTMTCAY